jgi:hypothetical protein
MYALPYIQSIVLNMPVMTQKVFLSPLRGIALGYWRGPFRNGVILLRLRCMHTGSDGRRGSAVGLLPLGRHATTWRDGGDDYC